MDTGVTVVRLDLHRYGYMGSSLKMSFSRLIQLVCEIHHTTSWYRDLGAPQWNNLLATQVAISGYSHQKRLDTQIENFMYQVACLASEQDKRLL